MREYKDQEIDKHPLIASKYIKYISHSQPFKVVECMEKKVKDMEVKLNDHDIKTMSGLKQLNTTSQKTNDHKSKLTNLENRLAKLKKK